VASMALGGAYAFRKSTTGASTRARSRVPAVAPAQSTAGATRGGNVYYINLHGIAITES